MIALCCLLAVLIASGPTHGQLTTPLTCANLPDPPGSPCIEHNETTQAIYAPLYPSDSTVIVVFGPGDDTRIDVRFDVEIYMDCSGLLTPSEGGAPSTEIIYFLQTVEQDATLVTTGVGRDTRDILGSNMEVLRIRNVSYATGAVAGSQGRYHCYACPSGTPAMVDDIEACDTNATVLVTVLEDLPQVCTGSNDDELVFDRGEVPVKPGRDYVCLTQDPTPGPFDYALIEGMLDPTEAGNNLRFICQLAPGLNVPGHVATASFNGEDIFSGDTVFPNTALCPEQPEDFSCGIYELNDDLSIGFDIGITNADLDLYYGVYTCTITVADLDVTDSASFIASNCAPPTIASVTPQTTPSTGTQTIGSFVCRGSILSCPVDVTTATPVNITWTINGVEAEFISTAGAQTVEFMANTPGTYTCTATNDFGTVEASSEVVAPPTLDSSATVLMRGDSGCSRITDGGNFAVCPAVNETIEINCAYDISVPANIQILAGDILLSSNDGTQIAETVTVTSPDQAGEYNCRSQTAVCGFRSSQIVDVSVHAAPQIISGYTGLSAADLGVTQVSVVGPSVSTDIAEGDSIALLCPSTGIMQPTAQWTLGGSVVDDTDPRITITQSTDISDNSIEVSILTITNLMSSDGGIYMCTASNNVIGAAAMASVTLGIQAAPGPQLTITITNSVGDDVSATSCARIDPVPAGVQACPFVGERVVISCVSNPPGQDVTLHIPPADAAHTQNTITASSIQEGGNIPNGMYSCRSDSEQDTGTLQLYDRPQIFVNYMPTALLTMQLMATQVFVVGSSDTMNFVMGDSLALVCPFTGIPMPTVQWTHNGTAVDATDPRITILQTTDQADASLQLSILNISALMSSDVGIYRCTASNVAGVAAESISLGETEAPKPVLTISITDSFGRDWTTTSCFRVDPRPTGIDVCPFVGETVVISCVSSPPGSDVSLHIPPSGAEHTEDQITASSIQIAGNIPNGVYSCRLNGEEDSGTLRLYEPPSIERNAPPPDPPIVPGGGEVEDVARLEGEAIPVQEGTNAILYFPFAGLDATASFFRVVGDTRVEITDATPGYMIIPDPDNQAIFLVVTNFTSGDAGMYEFVASNDAGTVSTTATLIVARENVWVASPWSACEPDCHKGERVRQVVCREMPGKVLQPDNECPAPKPPTTELCVNRGPCYLIPQWAHGDWSECSHPCGGGYRERDIFCIIPRTGALVDHSNCHAHSTPPSSFEYCNLHPCCTKDLYSEWCKMIRGTSFCAISPYYDVYCCWSCSGGAVPQ